MLLVGDLPYHTYHRPTREAYLPLQAAHSQRLPHHTVSACHWPALSSPLASFPFTFPSIPPAYMHATDPDVVGYIHTCECILQPSPTVATSESGSHDRQDRGSRLLSATRSHSYGKNIPSCTSTCRQQHCTALHRTVPAIHGCSLLSSSSICEDWNLSRSSIARQVPCFAMAMRACVRTSDRAGC